MAEGGFRWEGDLTEQRLDQIGPTVKRAMVAAAKKRAPEIESWMRNNAAWTDRTGNARNGLRVTTQISENSVRLILSHSVPYGIWLEVRFDGRYAILEPALREWAPKVIDLAARLAFAAGRPSA